MDNLDITGPTVERIALCAYITAIQFTIICLVIFTPMMQPQKILPVTEAFLQKHHPASSTMHRCSQISYLTHLKPALCKTFTAIHLTTIDNDIKCIIG
jgi:hypothetical protein